MNARQAIHDAILGVENIVKDYLKDLSDADLLVRPVPGANHIAWQLGHLITSEKSLVEAAFPGAMPPLPDGFMEKYTPETSASDDPQAFHAKAEYLRLHDQQRAGTYALLDKLKDEDLDKPAPEQFRSFMRNIGDLFSIQGIHWMMHAGQWAVVRRKLGRKPLF